MNNDDEKDDALETAPTEAPPPPKQRRGFATLSPEQRREVSSRGGKAAHARGTAHRWTSEEAERAGALGGAKSKRGPTRRSGAGA